MAHSCERHCTAYGGRHDGRGGPSCAWALLRLSECCCVWMRRPGEIDTYTHWLTTVISASETDVPPWRETPALCTARRRAVRGRIEELPQLTVWSELPGNGRAF